MTLSDALAEVDAIFERFAARGLRPGHSPTGSSSTASWRTRRRARDAARRGRRAARRRQRLPDRLDDQELHRGRRPAAARRGPAPARRSGHARWVPELAGPAPADGRFAADHDRAPADDVGRAADRRSVGRPPAGPGVRTVRRAAARRLSASPGRPGPGSSTRTSATGSSGGSSRQLRRRVQGRRPDAAPRAARDDRHDLLRPDEIPADRLAHGYVRRDDAWLEEPIDPLRRAGLRWAASSRRSRPRPLGRRLHRRGPAARRPGRRSPAPSRDPTRDAAGPALGRCRAHLVLDRGAPILLERRLRLRPVRLPTTCGSVGSSATAAAIPGSARTCAGTPPPGSVWSRSRTPATRRCTGRSREALVALLVGASRPSACAVSSVAGDASRRGRPSSACSSAGTTRRPPRLFSMNVDLDEPARASARGIERLRAIHGTLTPDRVRGAGDVTARRTSPGGCAGERGRVRVEILLEPGATAARPEADAHLRPGAAGGARRHRPTAGRACWSSPGQPGRPTSPSRRAVDHEAIGRALRAAEARFGPVDARRSDRGRRRDDGDVAADAVTAATLDLDARARPGDRRARPRSRSCRGPRSRRAGGLARARGSGRGLKLVPL